MADQINGGLMYHENQETESMLCALHCLNNLLQGPFFTESDLAYIAARLDRAERGIISDRDGDADNDGGFSGDFVLDDTPNAAADGNFSIQVIEEALKVWDMEVIPFDSPTADKARLNPELETAFICHEEDHWFCIRNVNKKWYTFNSLYAGPIPLSSNFYLSAYLDTFQSSGHTILVVRGNFMKNCPAPYNFHGQWLTPNSVKMISESIDASKAPPKSQSSLIGSCSGLFNAAPKTEQELEDLEILHFEAALVESLKDYAVSSSAAGFLKDYAFSSSAAGLEAESGGTQGEGTATSKDVQVALAAPNWKNLSLLGSDTDATDVDTDANNEAAEKGSISVTNNAVAAGSLMKKLSPPSSDTVTTDTDTDDENGLYCWVRTFGTGDANTDTTNEAAAGVLKKKLSTPSSDRDDENGAGGAKKKWSPTSSDRDYENGAGSLKKKWSPPSSDIDDENGLFCWFRSFETGDENTDTNNEAAAGGLKKKCSPPSSDIDDENGAGETKGKAL